MLGSGGFVHQRPTNDRLFQEGTFLPLAVFAAVLLFGVASVAPEDARGNESEAAGKRVVSDSILSSAVDYRFVGPYRGGRVHAVAGVAERPFTFYMGAAGGGVWKTTTAGREWTNVSDPFFSTGSIGAIDVANNDPEVVYVGTGVACIRGNTSTGQGVYRSRDAGETWEHVGLREVGQIGDVLVHPRDPKIVYVAAVGKPFGPNPERGVFRSTDGGDNWEKILFISDSTGVVDLSINPENPREIYAAAWRAERKPWDMISGAEEGGLFRTRDGGDSWTRLGGGLPQGVVGKIGVAVSPADPDRVWALVEAEGEDGGLYRSDDGGDAWRRINGSNKIRLRPWYYNHITAHPRDERSVFIETERFWRSDNGGRTFEEIPTPHVDNHDLWVNPERPRIMIESNDGGAHVSLNGGETWSSLENQPTAQIYRVEVDDQFPYRIYGAQQDNSTISLPLWRDAPGISPQQYWRSLAGGESGHIATRRGDPNITYAGSHGGVLDRMNRDAWQVQNVRAYPELHIGQAPKDLKYRFQWNAPIETSPHDSEVVYHAAQKLLRTRNGGQSWTEISPDLTYDDSTKQGYSGGPITHDISSVEFYNTIFAVTPSPHEEGTIWVGTDDGRVWLTRSGGGNTRAWEEVTPDRLPKWTTVNAIEVSPHDPATAYVSAFRFRSNDYRPFVFVTEDYGQSWRLLTPGDNGIPADEPVRVVRQDPEREQLLYAGTETGVFISTDGGAQWRRLQRDLPRVPVTDLEVHRGDLVLSTQGRGLWVVDDLTVLRQMDAVEVSEPHLFEPEAAFRVQMSGTYRGERWSESPPRGAVLHYYLPDASSKSVRLEIRDAEGRLVQRFAPEGGDRPGTDSLATGAGETHRAVWDLRYPEVDAPEEKAGWGFRGGPRAPPGEYSVRLAVDGEAVTTRTLTVRKDPRLETVSRAELEDQFDLAIAVRDTLSRVYDAVERLRSVEEQLRSLGDRLDAPPGADAELGARADELADRADALERDLIQPRIEVPIDALNYEGKFDDEFATLYGYVANTDAGPTEGARRRFEDLNEQWDRLRSRVREFLEGEIEEYNEALAGAVAPVQVSSLESDREG